MRKITQKRVELCENRKITQIREKYRRRTITRKSKDVEARAAWARAFKNGRKTEKLFINVIFGFYFNTFKRKSDEDQTQQETQQELIKVGLEHCNLCVQAGGEGCTWWSSAELLNSMIC